mgnify:CR=1 FL=1
MQKCYIINICWRVVNLPDTITFDELIPSLSKRDDFETIKRAYEYAYNEHKGMKRLTGDDFITHPLEVTKILMELNVDDTTIIASLLHEVINNGSKTYEDLVEDFGEDIAKIVLSVSKINKLELPDNNESSVIYLRKIRKSLLLIILAPMLVRFLKVVL